jgi:hypothetical protein
MKPSTKQILRASGMLAACIGLSSCSELRSRYYPGERVDLVKKLPEVSVWQFGESNTLVLACMDWNEKDDAFSTISFPVVLSELGSQMFLSSKYDCEGEEQDLYTIFRVVAPLTESGSIPDTLFLLNVDGNRFERDIAEGKVGAKKHQGTITLEGSKEEQDKYFRLNPNSLFSLEHAWSLKRIAGKREDGKSKTAGGAK